MGRPTKAEREQTEREQTDDQKAKAGSSQKLVKMIRAKDGKEADVPIKEVGNWAMHGWEEKE